MAYTFYNLSIEVLERIQKSLTAEEIWIEAKRLGLNKKLNKNTGLTPDRTISARIYDDIKDNGDTSRFIKASKNPVKFYLNGMPINNAPIGTHTKDNFFSRKKFTPATYKFCSFRSAF